jgi:hypothetical protein
MTLAEWEAKWTLNGDHLYCNRCRLAQWPYNAGHSFLHDLDCPALSAEPEYPWRDLARIVSADQQA